MAMRNLAARNLQKTLVAHYSKANQPWETSWIPKDIKTHTGQTFAEDDYRLVRFVDKTKLVNPNWGIKLVNEIPPAKCNTRVVWCDGGGGATGHPRVYINLDKPGIHSCNYCGLRFSKDSDH